VILEQGVAGSQPEADPPPAENPAVPTSNSAELSKRSDAKFAVELRIPTFFVGICPRMNAIEVKRRRSRSDNRISKFAIE
jgi:hypothetical protein